MAEALVLQIVEALLLAQVNYAYVFLSLVPWWLVKVWWSFEQEVMDGFLLRRVID